MTKTIPILCGSVAGKPSPLGVKMHDAGYVALGLPMKYLAIGTDDLSSIVSSVRNLEFRGLGVSMPFKQEIIKYLDVVTPEVESIGACNTVVNVNGKLSGYNTDYRGAMQAIEECSVVKTLHRAVIIGAGGVARAIAYGLKEKGLDVYIAGRNANSSSKLVEDLKLSGSVPLEKQGDIKADLVVNATPIADIVDCPVVLNVHEHAKVLLDVVFQVKNTQLTSEAERLGLEVARGWRMLLLQGAEQFKLYTEQTPPIEAMSVVLSEALA